MPKVYSVKVDDATAHHFDNALRVLGTTANAKLNELISDYMLGKPQVYPPPVPTGKPAGLPPPLPAPDHRPLAAVMQRLRDLAGDGGYALRQADMIELTAALDPLELHYEKVQPFGLVLWARRTKDAGAVTDDAPYAVRLDEPALVAFGRGQPT